MNKTVVRLLLVSILLFAYSARIWRVALPTKYYFDEVYHAFTAQAYAENDPRGYEWWHEAPEGVAYEWLHPPLAKVIQAGSIYFLADSSFSWRFPSVLFGVLTIWSVYLLTLNLTKKYGVALLAAFIASLDGLLLTMSRITMNDIFVTFFILLCLAYYWRWVEVRSLSKKKAYAYWLAASLSAGLASASKWSGVFVIGAIALWEIWQTRPEKNLRHHLVWLGGWITSLVLFLFGVGVGIGLIDFPMQNIFFAGYFVLGSLLIAGQLLGWRHFLSLLIGFVLIPIFTYVASFGQFWLQGHTLDQFRELHRQIWWYQTNLDATHPYQSQPWQWVLNLKPVWFWVEYLDGKRGNIYALANPAIAWLGISSAVWLAITSWTKKQSWRLFLLISYLSVWLPWSLSPRIMFFYHYTPGIALLSGSLGIMLVDWWESSWVGKIVASLSLSLVILAFVYFFPIWTGVLIPERFVDSFFWFESWR